MVLERLGVNMMYRYDHVGQHTKESLQNRRGLAPPLEYRYRNAIQNGDNARASLLSTQRRPVNPQPIYIRVKLTHLDGSKQEIGTVLGPDECFNIVRQEVARKVDVGNAFDAVVLKLKGEVVSNGSTPRKLSVTRQKNNVLTADVVPSVESTIRIKVINDSREKYKWMTVTKQTTVAKVLETVQGSDGFEYAKDMMAYLGFEHRLPNKSCENGGKEDNEQDGEDDEDGHPMLKDIVTDHDKSMEECGIVENSSVRVYAARESPYIIPEKYQIIDDEVELIREVFSANRPFVLGSRPPLMVIPEYDVTAVLAEQGRTIITRKRARN